MSYTAPTREQAFVLETIADLPRLAKLDPFASAADPDLIDAVLEGGATFAHDVFAPLNHIGDMQGARWNDGSVTLPNGFREAYGQYVEAGWGALAGDVTHGGQAMPFVLNCAVLEQLSSANTAFTLCMILTGGAVEALSVHGSPEQKRLYLPKLVSGQWTGTMNLTEPQAGSDVGALRTVAVPAPDGSWRIKGGKIFITWGEHDAADNIIHLVLARTPGAPAGTKGISLFLVPKFLPGHDGEPGERNDLRCVSIEHKLGIHASPTCTMSFGDDDCCTGWLIGPEHGGMRAMFTMMNNARIAIGLQGVAIAERAYQAALAYACDRVQFAPIIDHLDVRRMLLTMRATTQAIRALTYWNAAAVDLAQGEATPSARADAQALADWLTPITKGYSTDMGVEIASLGIQVFGGMGYIEETGAAQHLRDARIAPIYEGTNGIQALDLVGRKLRMDGGGVWRKVFDEIRAFGSNLAAECALTSEASALSRRAEMVSEVSERLLAASPDEAAAVATPYLRMVGVLLGGYLLLRQAVAAQAKAQQDDFLEAKVATARFFISDILPQIDGLHPIVANPSPATLRALSADQFAAS